MVLFWLVKWRDFTIDLQLNGVEMLVINVKGVSEMWNSRNNL
jgi:hypothetical protein